MKFKAFGTSKHGKGINRYGKNFFATLISTLGRFNRANKKKSVIYTLIKVKQTSHANHTMRGLRYPRLILERLGFPPVLTETLQVLASSYLPQKIFNFS